MARTLVVRKSRRDWWLLAASCTGMALVVGWALFGETGIFAWNDYQRELNQRRAELVEVRRETSVLANHRDLLDPRRADPDLVEEKVRGELNLLHPDDIVVPLPQRQ
jgi:cell division protein FtsB